jgi:hypothetical protein
MTVIGIPFCLSNTFRGLKNVSFKSAIESGRQMGSVPLNGVKIISS